MLVVELQCESQIGTEGSLVTGIPLAYPVQQPDLLPWLIHYYPSSQIPNMSLNSSIVKHTEQYNMQKTFDSCFVILHKIPQ